MPNTGPLSPQALYDYFARLVVSNSVAGAAAFIGMPLDIPILVPDAATGDLDFVMPEKFEVIGFTCIKRNGAGAANTMQLKKAAAVISDAVACAVDNAVTNAASIDDAAGVNVFAAGETLRITATRAAGTRDALCIVRGYIRP